MLFSNVLWAAANFTGKDEVTLLAVLSNNFLMQWKHQNSTAARERS